MSCCWRASPRQSMNEIKLILIYFIEWFVCRGSLRNLNWIWCVLLFLWGVMGGARPALLRKGEENTTTHQIEFNEARREAKRAQLMIGEMKLIEWLMESIMKSMNERQSINKRFTKRHCRAASQGKRKRQTNQFINSKEKNWWNWIGFAFFCCGEIGSSSLFSSALLSSSIKQHNWVVVWLDWRK